MGNRVPKPSNKLMVDKLVEHPQQHIKSANVESVFRAVDRAFYFEIQEGQSIDPYDEVPWRNGNLHLSAPCIYANVVESLELRPGLSFLNLGSGTGYLNTIVGLLIGPNGINHGIEIHKDVVGYAYKKLEEFKCNSCAIYKFDFSEPVFVQGNCLNLNPDRKYDRIYLGAACLPEMESFIKKLVRPNGGILIMPVEGHLMKYTRSDENVWTSKELMPVNFTMMIGLNDMIFDHCNNNINNREMIDMPRPSAKNLKDLCRIAIKQQLRHKTNLMNPNLLHSDNIDRRRHRRAMASLAMHRVEEQRQADAIRAHRAASAAAAAAGGSPFASRLAASRVQARKFGANRRGSHRCCRGIRGEHPISTSTLTQHDDKSEARTQISNGNTSHKSKERPTTSGLNPDSINGQKQLSNDNNQQSDFRIVTRSASRALLTRRATTQDNDKDNDAFSTDTAISASQPSTSNRIIIQPSGAHSNDVQRNTDFGQLDRSANEFRGGDRNESAGGSRKNQRRERLINSCIRAPNLTRQRDHGELHRQSPLFVFGGGGITGCLLSGNQEIMMAHQQSSSGSSFTRPNLQSTALRHMSAPLRQRFNATSRSNYPVRVCCPTGRHQVLDSPVGAARALLCRAVQNASQDNIRIGYPVLRLESTEEEGEEGDHSSIASGDLSWSTVSSLCESISSQSFADLRVNINDDGGSDNIADDGNDDDGILGENGDDDNDDDDDDEDEDNEDEDDDDDEQSSLGESWDSFLIDANGDNADTSDEDDGIDYDEHGNPMVHTSFDASIVFDVEDDDVSEIERASVDGWDEPRLVADLDQDRPVSSRLRSSSLLQSNQTLKKEAEVSDGQSTSAGPRATTASASTFPTSSSSPPFCKKSAATKVQRHCSDIVMPENQNDLHRCRRHRVQKGSAQTLTATETRSRSDSGHSDEVNSDHRSRHNRCSHLRSKKSAHKCRWHIRRQQLRRTCPLHNSRDNCDRAALLPSTARLMTSTAASDTPTDSIEENSTQSKIRARLRNWLTDRFDRLTTVHPPMIGGISSVAVRADSNPGRAPGLQRSGMRAAQLVEQRKRFASVNSALTRLRTNLRTSAASSVVTAKRKRQTSSSSSASSFSPTSNSEPASPSLQPSINRKQLPTRRTTGSRVTNQQCLCSRKDNRKAQVVATTSNEECHTSANCTTKRALRCFGVTGTEANTSTRAQSSTVSLENPQAANDADEEDSVECEWEQLSNDGGLLHCGKRHYCRRHSHTHFCRRHGRHHRRNHHRRCHSLTNHSLRHVRLEQPSESLGLPELPTRVERNRELETRRRVERRERRNLRRPAGESTALNQTSARSSNNSAINATSILPQQSRLHKKGRRENECEKYRTHISHYIKELPLPRELRDYLNYDREH